MSSIKLTADSGGGTFEIKAPASSANTRVLTFPDVKGLTLGGILMFDQYRVTTSFTGAVDPISNNIERVDTNSPAFIGSAMSVSSGIFTFPSTGMYEVCFYLKGRMSGDFSRFHQAIIHTTTDGTNFSEAAFGSNNYFNPNATVVSSCVAVIYFDVTDTSTHKVKFSLSVNSSSTETDGSSTLNQTYFTFKRIGDT